jgi:hypothetical protein
MPAQPIQDFRRTVVSRYDTTAQPSERTTVAQELDDTLWGLVAQQWEDILLLEFQIANPPTGDPGTVLADLRGALHRVIETWQESILARPRVTLPPSDIDFHRQVVERYNTPPETASPAEIARSLDHDLAKLHEEFWSTCFQLRLLVAELAQTRDPDDAALTKENLQALLRIWKASILNRPRAVPRAHARA